ncbi:MAG: PQQ-binding-like beta-propeller repeat protein [Myxococcales bacterium]|nr:PQQ-binding-like beta-propeller repeat protein [Myxococcales bacterium]MCB9716574.1 PQQ-binding-like beta-propeller repeat protein [Myxococcales bacterium]
MGSRRVHRRGRRSLVSLGLALACTGPEPARPALHEALEAEPEPVPAVEPEPEPEPVIGDEPWVWIEGWSADHTCLAGCTRIPPKGRRETVPRSGQPYQIDPEGPGTDAEAMRMRDDDTPIWRVRLPGHPDSGAPSSPRILQCGDELYATMASPFRPWYRVFRLDPSTGEVRAMADRHWGDEHLVDHHGIQIACDGTLGLRVFGRIRGGKHTTLYVDQLLPDGRRWTKRPMPGTFADARPVAPGPDDQALRTAYAYRFVGGEPGPHAIGLDAPPPRSLVVTATADGEPRWTVDLGPAVRDDHQVVETDELAVLRLGTELVAIHRATGELRWRTRGGGSREELLRRPGHDGTWGCSRCPADVAHLRLERGGLVLSVTGGQRYVNVIDPSDGRVLLRRIWE